MKAITFLALLLTLTLAVSCNKDLPNDEVINLDEVQTIIEGNLVEFKEGDFFIEFKEVSSDSRCPVNLVCEWEGVADIVLTIHQNETEKDVIIHTINSLGMQLSKTIECNDYTIEVIQLSPIPGEPNYGDDFELDLKITKP